MSDSPHLILHVGAPKCGSSALQSALSLTPDMTDSQGRQLRYSAWSQIGGVGPVQYGNTVTTAARRSAYGYATWPNVSPKDANTGLFNALNKARLAGLRKGYIPVASNEGWISRSELFADHLKRWGNPPVDVVAFLRPVIDWHNSAFWQWGIWYVPSLDAWFNRSKLSYSFGLDLEAWSQIPNVRVRFTWAQPDIVEQFSRMYGVNLPPASENNVSSSPALIGVLMRHRRLRPDGHQGYTEFVVQRWCPQVAGRRLWAVMARHVLQQRPVVRDNLASLRRIASDEAMQSVCDDPRWFDEARYHNEINAGVSPFNDPVQQAALYGSLVTGLARATQVCGHTLPEMPTCPAPDATIKEWDQVLLAILDALLETDQKVRSTAGRGVASILVRAGERLSMFQDQMFNKSR